MLIILCPENEIIMINKIYGDSNIVGKYLYSLYFIVARLIKGRK